MQRMLRAASSFLRRPVTSVIFQPYTTAGKLSFPLNRGLKQHILKQPSKPSVVQIPAARNDAPNTALSFAELEINEELLQALEEKGLTKPTEIQDVAVPSLLHDRHSDFLIASHTGSGKTLAYLLPIVHILKEEEQLDGPPAKPKRPRALILGPTRELTDQILAVAKSISHIAKFRSTAINGGGDLAGQRAALSRPIDVLVGTPAKIAQHADKGNLFYGDVQVVVLDEADTMLDRGFGPEVLSILKAVRSKPTPARCILVSATMTKQVRTLLKENFPSMRMLETSSLHKGVENARHLFLQVPGTADKLDQLLQVVEGDHRKGRRVMIFCNTLDSCRAVDYFLGERGVQTVCYHGDIPLEDRRNAIKSFATESSEDMDGGIEPAPVLVCTDLAARGLDIPGRVDHVVNFDFPYNPVDYLHRTGRTARAGASGKITSLVGKADRVLASRIEESLTKGLPLDALSADRAVLPPHMRPKKETLKRRAIERKYGKKSGGSSSSKRWQGQRADGTGRENSNRAPGSSNGGYSSRGSGGRNNDGARRFAK